MNPSELCRYSIGVFLLGIVFTLAILHCSFNLHPFILILITAIYPLTSILIGSGSDKPLNGTWALMGVILTCIYFLLWAICPFVMPGDAKDLLLIINLLLSYFLFWFNISLGNWLYYKDFIWRIRIER